MYTDCLTEARDASGTFYPLADRLTVHVHLATDPDTLLGWVEQDVRAYAGDDPNAAAALFALTWFPALRPCTETIPMRPPSGGLAVWRFRVPGKCVGGDGFVSRLQRDKYRAGPGM
ncbi:hypothetical protein [Streptomyces hydrogenans]|uniref:hypothetical protein n=1 Tax=Streptomyces hydrogenans TaxID=1873719 RepID=UPI0035D66FD4